VLRCHLDTPSTDRVECGGWYCCDAPSEPGDGLILVMPLLAARNVGPTMEEINTTALT
jgi:hypothetical protein